MKNEDENFEPVRDDSIIVLKTYNNEFDAVIASEHLKVNHIESFISRNDPAMVGMMRSARLFVKKADAKRAIKVLEAMEA